MDYTRPFRDAEATRGLIASIASIAEPGRTYHLMEFCGSHTHTIARFGLEDLLPAEVRMIHGPG